MTKANTKILHIEGGKNVYGGALQVYYLIRELSKHTINNVLVCPKSSDLVAKAAPYSKVIGLDMKSDIDFILLFQIIKILKKEKPDLVHLHSRRIAEILGGLASKFCNLPVILTRRVDNKEGYLITKIKYLLYGKVITISDAIRNVLLKQGVSSHKLSCVKSAVDSALYSQPIDKKEFRKRLNFDSDTFLIGMIAQFIPRKGHKFLIKVLRKLLEKNKNIKILFYGQGPLYEPTKKLVKDLGLENYIKFMGFVSDLEKQIGALDLVVHPAEKEGLGVSLLQASSAKVPVIANNVGGIPEIVRHGENGFLVSPNNERMITEAIIKIMKSSELRIFLGKRGKEIIEQEFSINSMTKGNIKIYEKLINRQI